MVIAVPGVSYAQLDLKAKAVETLTNGVMKELEKKFTETVAKEAISAAAKEYVVKNLSEMARPIVKSFIDSATSGRLPNQAELVNKVLNDIIPRVPQLVAAAAMEGVADSVAQVTGQVPTAGQVQASVSAQLQHNYDDEKDFSVETINDGSSVRITRYAGKSTELRIPPRIGDRPVTEIGERVFTKKGLTSVVIPESVIFIGNMAFAENPISSISIGANVYITNNAFDGSGYNPSFVGFYNSQGRKAGIYNNGWRYVSAVAPQPTAQPAVQPIRTGSGSSTMSSGTTGTAKPASTTSNSTPSESAVVFAGNGHRYEVIDVPTTWAKARDDCEKRGGYLATITSKEEQKFIQDLIRKGKKDSYWLGGYREGKKTKENWRWVTGEDFTYKKWANGQPDNYNGREDKLELYKSDGSWNDNMTNNVCGYICEWDAE